MVSCRTLAMSRLFVGSSSISSWGAGSAGHQRGQRRAEAFAAGQRGHLLVGGATRVETPEGGDHRAGREPEGWGRTGEALLRKDGSAAEVARGVHTGRV
ncbi:hypothetical protein GCM10020295_12480 [Streptomyces cinereospinus]